MNLSTAALRLLVACVVCLVGFLGFVGLVMVRIGECDRPLPPLLLSLTAVDEGDVWTAGCGLPKGKKQAFSPELTKRLQRLFPAGSDAAAVERDLQALGFKVVSPCPNDPSARLAQFLQKGCAWPMNATLIWHRTEDAKVADLSGHVFFKPGGEY
ncbi:hypothetical protein [Sinorhizobium fredii]|uniref:hypothetical protein n=1 Tax=Rhizobium fredii TaxID=380 RepID=UPI0013E8D818|nr:hypothetical protein [Sinorhizobium fredii]